MKNTIAMAFVAALFCACSDDGGGQDAVDGGVLDHSATVEAGGHLVIHITADGTPIADEIVDPYTLLSDLCAQAVDRSPEWIRERLAATLSQCEAENAEGAAQQILDSSDPIIDEVAWSIAVTDPSILDWMVGGGGASLFTKNAEAIYAMDGLLGYASLVELDDGRTTLELVGENGPFELDPESYYWFVVHPRAYFELPAHVSGEHWRDFFVEADLYGETLIDAVGGAQTMAEAAQAIGDWIQNIMTFGYGTNDVLPITIYLSSYGSCGEYSIFTTAVARTVLMPTLVASARADDHEWNEYWDRRWIMWDNSMGEIGENPHYPYIDWPEIFDDDSYNNAGVLGEVAHVLRFRGDGYVWPSDLYTDYEQVTIAVTDAAGEPVEGARVVAMTAESSYGMAAWAYTDPFGEAALELGDDLLFGFAVDHGIFGKTPATGADPTLWVAQAAGPYEETIVFDSAYPRVLTDMGSSPGGDLPLTLSFQIDATLQHQVNHITEGYELGDTYPVEIEGGVLDVFVTDAAGFAAFEAGEPFDAYAVTLAQEQAQLELAIPAGEDWYVVLDNSWWPASDKRVSVSVDVGDQ